jgi:hypothetical protein
MFGYSRFSEIARAYAHRPQPAHPPLVADTQLYVFGDPAYAPGFGVLGPYKRYPARPFTPAEQEFNTQMSKKRIAVEWSFGEILQRWHFVSHKYKLQLGLSPIGAYYAVSVLLSNLHVCYYGSKSSRKFGINPPTAREYIHPEVECPPLELD